jgi:hypothetical protein
MATLLEINSETQTHTEVTLVFLEINFVTEPKSLTGRTITIETVQPFQALVLMNLCQISTALTYYCYFIMNFGVITIHPVRIYICSLIRIFFSLIIGQTHANLKFVINLNAHTHKSVINKVEEINNTCWSSLLLLCCPLVYACCCAETWFAAISTVIIDVRSNALEKHPNIITDRSFGNIFRHYRRPYQENKGTHTV